MKINTAFSSKYLLVGACLFVFSLAFQAGISSFGTPAVNGAAIFKKNCMMCHGADGKGFSALKTPNFTDPKWQSSIKDKDMREVIKNGKKGTAMLPFGNTLNEGEISAVMAYIRSLNSAKRK